MCGSKKQLQRVPGAQSQMLTVIQTQQWQAQTRRSLKHVDSPVKEGITEKTKMMFDEHN